MPLMLRWLERSQVYHPHRRMDADGTELGCPVEEARFAAADGVRLHGWFYPAAADSPSRGWAWILCHGNAGNISHRLPHARLLRRTGANVLLFDYRGYGRSAGRPSEEGTYLDAQAAWDWLGRKGIPGSRILVIGESLGGGVASELTLRRRTAGLVLLCSFTSVPDLAEEWFRWLPVRRFGRICYDTRSKLARIRVPVLVVHSRADTLIGFHHAEANLAAANEPKWLCEIQGDHNDFLEPGAEEVYLEGLKRLFAAARKNVPAVETQAADAEGREASGGIETAR